MVVLLLLLAAHLGFYPKVPVDMPQRRRETLRAGDEQMFCEAEEYDEQIHLNAYASKPERPAEALGVQSGLICRLGCKLFLIY